VTDGDLFKLVTRLPPPPHDFGAARSVPANPALGRHQQTERTCMKCPLVKITVHPPQGGGWREWRWGDAPSQFIDVVTPACVPVIEAERAAS
jgi:hypothetical protein